MRTLAGIAGGCIRADEGQAGKGDFSPFCGSRGRWPDASGTFAGRTRSLF